MRSVIIIFVLLFSQVARAQSAYPDSLIAILDKATNDSVRFRINQDLAGYYFNRDRRLSSEYNEEALIIARNNNMTLDVAARLDSKGYYLNKEDRYGEALKCYMEGLTLAENPANEGRTWSSSAKTDPRRYRMQILAGLHHDLGLVMRSTGKNREAIQQFRICLLYLDKALPTSHNSALMNIGAVYLDLNMLDSAMYYQRKAIAANHITYRPTMYKYVGDIYFRTGNADSARYYYYQGLRLATKQRSLSQSVTCQMGLALVYLGAENKDSSLFYASAFMKGFKELRGNPVKDINISIAYELLYLAYRLQGQKDSTMKYLQLAFASRDSINRARILNLTQYQNLTFDEQLRLEDLEKKNLQTQGRIRTYSLLTGLVFILIVALILYRNTRQKQKANTVLQKTLSDLKAAQAQLIHAEKMASLGELTAGIAHEIQNPLNFVNNFAEVNTELITELKEEIEKGDKEVALTIMHDLLGNEEKIHHHGKRADAIVKGMLQHSRAGSGQNEPTDINALADEYLRLAYHGLRAKDTTFNAEFKTELDPSLPMIKVTPQDIGRVLLNLINNAFYAVDKKSRQGIGGYKPEVTVITRRHQHSAVIIVKDNGDGIPDTIKEKIFQPFFTTKPTGEGTGLGLSLSYDIITKGHGGELSVEAKEGEGSEFTITIPA